MSPNRRIFLNIVATYGRSLYALVLGLFTARWVLLTLGRVDYGLYGVVAGLTVLVGFLSYVLSASVGRFYAVSVGGNISATDDNGLETCRQWFSVAVVVLFSLPLLLVLIMYPFGVFMIRYFLEIPSERVTACIWVWRFSCLSWFAGVSTIPFQAMYVAKQEIARVTIYNVASTTASACCIYYMYCHPGDWLVRYALSICVCSVVPHILLSIRACRLYHECRFVIGYALCREKVQQLLAFSGWQVFGTAASVLRGQGIAIVINKYFGPKVNAATTVGLSMANHCGSLALSMTNALSPAIMNAYGAGQLARMERLVYSACKISSMALMVFAIPLLLEIKKVLVVWLKEPPPFSAGWCAFILIAYISEKFVAGHIIAISAYGKIKKFHLIANGILLIMVPVACIVVECNGGVYGVGALVSVTMILRTLLIAYLSRSLAHLSCRYWVKRVLLPLIVVMLTGLLSGLVVRTIMEPSLVRICVTTLLVNTSMLLVAWLCLFDRDERAYCCAKFGVAKVLHKLHMFEQ